jgi:hypothetical protein
MCGPFDKHQANLIKLGQQALTRKITAGQDLNQTTFSAFLPALNIHSDW